MDQVRFEGNLLPPRSHHRGQMGQIQPGHQVKVLGAIGVGWGGGTNPRLWVRSRRRCWAQCWPSQMAGRHRLLGDGDHCSRAQQLLRGLGTEVGSGTFPAGSSPRSPLLDQN